MPYEVMQSEVTCPLCGSRSHRQIEKIKYDDIRYIYRNVHKVQIPAEHTEYVYFMLCLSCDVRFFTPAICGSPEFYEQLQKFPWYYLAEKSEYQIVKQWVRPDSSVLEIGCGAGNFYDFLPKGCSYRGLEFNELAIRKATTRGLQVERMAVEDFAKSRQAGFDLVCAFQVLEHVQFPCRFIEAAASLLNPDGVLAVSVPSEDSLESDALNNVLNTPPHHITRWSDKALRNVCQTCALSLLHLEHEQLSVVNTVGFSRAQVARSLRRLGFKVPQISRLAATWPMRGAMYLAAKPVEWSYKTDRRPAVGHSVVAAYKRLQGLPSAAS